MVHSMDEHSTYLTRSTKDLKIFTCNLSTKFNWDIVDHFTEKRHRFDLSSVGYGTLLSITHGLSIRNTYQNVLDVIFYDRLMKSNLMTVNPEEADMFYIPYFHDMVIDDKSSVAKYLLPELNKLPFYKLHKPCYIKMIGWPTFLVNKGIDIFGVLISASSL